MRLLSSWEQYLATTDDGGIQVHQYASSDVEADIGAGTVSLEIRTGYPWDGRVTIHVAQTPDRPWTLSLRVPRWCRTGAVTLPGAPPAVVAPGQFEETRSWRAGDEVVLDLAMPVRVTEPDPRVDAVRGCVAVERGPLVYCVETADVPPGVELEDLRWDGRRQPVEVARPDIAPGVVGVEVPVVRSSQPDAELTAGAIPYYAWANRRPEGMRVWIPR
jgi:DUF1680 family protein